MIESKIVWIAIFTISLLGALLCTNRVGKFIVDDFDKQLQKLSVLQRWVYGVLDISPYSLLENNGKKWQTAFYIFMFSFIISGSQLAELASK